jgi:DNA sulfur modification protein DndB
MAFLDNIQVDLFKGKLTSDLILLGKIYKSKKRDFLNLSVDHSLVEYYLKEGWEIERTLKTKTNLKIAKTHSKKFEDDVWCQFYELGYRTLNYDEHFELPFGKNPEDKKQIDVIAIDKETIIIVECKSSLKPQSAPSYKDEFDLLSIRLDGFRKSLSQAFGENLKTKYIFATRNLRIDSESVDMIRFRKTNSFHYSDNIYSYVNNLIKCYKNAAHYQFLGLIFKNQLISNDRLEIPAIEGDMGGKKYYMFSIQPSLLLKMGFILHRTKTNEEDMPNYQRLLVPSRLNGITKFIDDGGYFPNSIIINFSQNKHNLEFHPSTNNNISSAKYGNLKIPNAYAIAYIIDGQHRLYGYANSKYINSNTIPVLAFKDLQPEEQLKIFVDINENQKAVSPSLRTMLREDLFWNSNRTDSRLAALRSSIIRELSESSFSPLYNKIETGADPALLTVPPFEKAIMESGLLPKAKGNKYIEGTLSNALYDTNNHDHNSEMNNSKKRIVQFIELCYEFAEKNYSDIYNRDKYFILSNRGTYAYITLVGSINKYLCENGVVSIKTSSKERFEKCEKYLTVLMEAIRLLNKEEEDKILRIQGQGAEKDWLYFFQEKINDRLPEFTTKELIEWKERQDVGLQDKGRTYGVAIEKKMKSLILNNLKILFKENWDLEIGSIKRKCSDEADKEIEKQYKETGIRPKIDWTEMFMIYDYKKIITDFWTKMPSESVDGFKNFHDLFSIDIGEKFNSTAERTKWISKFNSYRNVWAHEGSKERTLNKDEVMFLEKIYLHFYND